MNRTNIIQRQYDTLQSRSRNLLTLKELANGFEPRTFYVRMGPDSEPALPSIAIKRGPILPEREKSSTVQWAYQASPTVLSERPIPDFKKSEDFTAFLLELDKHKRACVHPADAIVPLIDIANESDTSTAAVYPHLIVPVYDIMYHLQVYGESPDFGIEVPFLLEVATEVYTKSDPDKTANDNQTKDDDEDDSGVRCDYVLCYRVIGEMGASEGTSTRQRREKTSMVGAIASSFEYETSKDVFLTTTAEGKAIKKKTLLPIEIKTYRSLESDVVQHIAQSVYFVTGGKSEIEAVKDTRMGVGRIKGILSALKQAIRYGDAYGSKYIALVDYNSCLVLMIPDGWKARGQSKGKPPMVINWFHATGKDVRLALAFAAWLGLQRIRDQARTLSVTNLRTPAP